LKYKKKGEKEPEVKKAAYQRIKQRNLLFIVYRCVPWEKIMS